MAEYVNRDAQDFNARLSSLGSKLFHQVAKCFVYMVMHMHGSTSCPLCLQSNKNAAQGICIEKKRKGKDDPAEVLV
jgi:hypothetical protein